MSNHSSARRLATLGVAGSIAVVAYVIAVRVIDYRGWSDVEESSGVIWDSSPEGAAQDGNSPAPAGDPNVEEPQAVAVSPTGTGFPSPPAGGAPSEEALGLPPMGEDVGAAEIVGLQTLCQEGLHLITELPPPDGPVPLRVRYDKKDEGMTWQKRSVLFEKYPSGMKTGRLVLTTCRVQDVNEAGRNAGIAESDTTLVSAAENSNGMFLGDVETQRRYTISENGSSQDVQESVQTDSGWQVQGRGDWDWMTAFPSEAMAVGQKYTLPMDTCIGAVPDSLTQEPARLDLVVSRRVLFDGQEAYEVKTEQRGYAQIDVKGVISIKAKVVGTGRYYVNAATGQVLWREGEYTFQESTFGPTKGLVLNFREEVLQGPGR